MKRLIIIFLVFMFGTASNVQADWQYTSWGMSVDQVKKAGGAKISRIDDVSKHSSMGNLGLLQAPFETGGFRFIARFMFDRLSQKLSVVSLELLDPSLGHRLHGTLVSKYGEPTKVPLGDVVKASQWRNEAANNNLSLLQIGASSYTLQYTPINSSTNKGF